MYSPRLYCMPPLKPTERVQSKSDVLGGTPSFLSRALTDDRPTNESLRPYTSTTTTRVVLMQPIMSFSTLWTNSTRCKNCRRGRGRWWHALVSNLHLGRSWSLIAREQEAGGGGVPILRHAKYFLANSNFQLQQQHWPHVRYNDVSANFKQTMTSTITWFRVRRESR